ncbi:related to enolase [Ramularia collo-cygni]|uniref:phosphopyruvate hydratase n=1 Tax=Ramularia collo-cygni TaxID=112498 RepID=A0A2D3UWK8_9PEZI|nr:related to enolase [Ramularia collo-cygni]CZT16617.1 related to enolase [Ramularia collo-cygni]
MPIQDIWASERLDSTGIPTIQTKMTTEHGRFASLVPSSAPGEANDVCQLRDGVRGINGGKGVSRAVQGINEIIRPALIGLEPATQLKEIDRLMRKLDSTTNLSNLGANAILSVSMCAARAGAQASGLPLYKFIAKEAGMSLYNSVMPVPFMVVLKGRQNSSNKINFREFMIAPIGAASFREAVRLNTETYECLKNVIFEKDSGFTIDDQGRFVLLPRAPSYPLDLLVEAIRRAGHEGRIKIGINAAGQAFERNGLYDAGDGSQECWTRSQLISLYQDLAKKYPILLLEDPFGHDDWMTWTSLNASFKNELELVGGALLLSNPERLQYAKRSAACNALLLKITQIGTISDSLAIAKEAFNSGFSVVVSHSSSETTDDFLADLTVGLRAGHLKSGAPCRGEHVVKYNRLMEIEETFLQYGLPQNCLYAGKAFEDAGDLLARCHLT